MSLPKSPVRRVVLGDLTPNTRTSPARRPHTTEELNKSPLGRQIRSPSKQAGSTVPTELLSAKSLLNRDELSRKRVREDDDEQENSIEGEKRRRPSQWAPAAILDPAIQPLLSSTSPRPAALSFESTTTIEDDQHANTPTGLVPSPAEQDDSTSRRPSLEGETVKGSFSSLIDYDPADASDRSHMPSMSPSASPQPAHTTANTVTSTVTKSDPTSLTSQVELLRLRLRIAMYKVRTDQIALPLAQLKVLDEFAAVSGQDTSSMSLLLPDGLPSPTRTAASSPELPTRSTMMTTSAESPLKPLGRLLPAPVLLPTAYSARFVENPPSSPPPPISSMQASPARIGEDETIEPPSLPLTRVSSPEKVAASAQHLTPVARHILEAEGEDNLSSSAVKGRAASGLLELMKSV